MTDAPIPTREGRFARVLAAGDAAGIPIAIVPALGMPGEILAPFRDLLLGRARVLVVELPGSGTASGVGAGVGTRELAGDLVAVIRALELPRVHLFGISLGGMVAQWAAIEAPDAIESLILASTTACGASAAIEGEVATLPFLRAIGKDLVGEAPAGAELAKRIVSPHVRSDPEEIERIEEVVGAYPREREEVLWLALAAARHDTRDRLGEVHAPTLVVTGARDEIIPPRLQAELASAIPGAEQVFVEGAGHDVTVDQPEATANAVLTFLDRRTVSGARPA